MDEHTALFWEGAFHLRAPQTPSSPSGRRQGHGSGVRRPLKKKPSALSPSLSPGGTALGVPLLSSCFQSRRDSELRAEERGRGGAAAVAGAQPVTFSVDAQAPMVEPELTEVGELHSLTDWQVSEASEEAELDEFCRSRGPQATKSNRKSKAKMGRGGHAHRERQTHTHEREG